MSISKVCQKVALAISQESIEIAELLIDECLIEHRWKLHVAEGCFEIDETDRSGGYRFLDTNEFNLPEPLETYKDNMKLLWCLYFNQTILMINGMILFEDPGIDRDIYLGLLD